MTTGMPISVSKRRHSSLCSRVTLTVRRENRSRSSAVPVSLASSPSALASSRFSKRFDSCRASRYKATPQTRKWSRATHHSLLHLRRLSIKDIRRLDTIFHYPNRAVEEAHEMARRLAGVVLQHLAVLLAHGDEELVDGHGGVDGDLAPEEGLDVVLLDSIRGVLGEECCEAFDTHLSRSFVWNVQCQCDIPNAFGM